MTQPNKETKPGQYGVSPGTGALGGLQKITFDGARQSIISSVLQSFQGVDAAGTNINGATNKAMNAAATAQADAVSAQNTANSAQDTATSNSSAIANLQNQQQQNQVGGATFSDSFDTWNTANWNSFKSGSVADMVVVRGQAGLDKRGNTDSGGVVALWKTPLYTDAQSASVVIGNLNQSGSFAGSGPVIRAAADLSTFVWAVAGGNSLYLGRGTRSGGVITLTQWKATGNAPIETGDALTLSAKGNTYTVQVSGVSLLSYTDIAGEVPVGSTNRWTGFMSQYLLQNSSWGANAYFGCDFDSFTTADTTQPTMVGTGWSIFRQDENGVPQPTGYNRIAQGTFDTLRASNNVNVNLGNGAIQVTKSGWYVISVGLQWTNPAASNLAYWTALYSAPSATGPWNLLRLSGEVTAPGTYASGATFVVFLAANTFVSPGYATLQGGTAVRGDPGGAATFFDGTLCSFA